MNYHLFLVWYWPSNVQWISRLHQSLFHQFQVYSWGTKDRGKLGRLLSLCHSIIPDPTTKHLTADLVRGILDKKEAVKIACGAHFCVVVLKDDSVSFNSYSFCIRQIFIAIFHPETSTGSRSSRYLCICAWEKVPLCWYGVKIKSYLMKLPVLWNQKQPSRSKIKKVSSERVEKNAVSFEFWTNTVQVRSKKVGIA